MIAQATSTLVIGEVIELDPKTLGRCRVKFPHLMDTESDWCSVVSPMGGPDRGIVMLPEVGDHVLVGFEHDDPLHGFVLGSIWDRNQKIPAGDSQPQENNLRFIRSRSGHVVRLDDTPGKEKIEIIDKSMEQSVVIDSAAKTTRVTTKSGNISVQAVSGKVDVTASDITIKSSGSLTIEPIASCWSGAYSMAISRLSAQRGNRIGSQRCDGCLRLCQ